MKTPKELAKEYVTLCDTIPDGNACVELEKLIAADRKDNKENIVSVEEGKDTKEEVSTLSGLQEQQKKGREGLDNQFRYGLQKQVNSNFDDCTPEVRELLDQHTADTWKAAQEEVESDRHLFVQALGSTVIKYGDENEVIKYFVEELHKISLQALTTNHE